MARAMPVLPEVGSRMVAPGFRRPSRSASSTMALAMRSFSEPVGFWPSSFAHMRTPGFGDSRWMPTSGVSPIAARMSSARMQGIIPAATDTSSAAGIGEPLPAGATSVGDDLPGRVRAGRTGDPPARVGAAAAEIQALEWHAVPGVPEQRPPGEELVEARLPVERMTTGQAVVALQVLRRDHLAGDHQAGQPRGEPLE